MYTSTPDYVRTPDELAAALARLADSPFVAIDTEFLRERSYYPKFCLLQIAHDDYCALIDVLALPSLAPLLDFLNDRERLKVLHAAHQDLEVLARSRGALLGVPVAPIAGPFLDTQAAAAFLDMPAHIGYGELVRRRLDLTLDKDQARTDWSRRPLSDAQLKYAAADVIYLVELYHNLKKALGHTLRWCWLEEDAEQWEDPKLYVTEPAEAWKRLRGLDQMQPEQRAAAKALAEWRESRAMYKDRPRAWILSDDTLRAIAESLPTTVEALAKIKGLPKRLAEKRGVELLQLIADSKAQAAHEPPARIFKPTPSEVGKITKLMELVRKEGARLHISPERLATRREVEALVFSGRLGGFAQGWRRHCFGERLIRTAEKLFTPQSNAQRRTPPLGSRCMAR